jgi:hypothetical protein
MDSVVANVREIHPTPASSLEEGDENLQQATRERTL